MLMNTLAILRGTFGNFRPLSLTTSTCVNLHRDLYHYLERALSPTCERYNVNEHPRNPSGYYGWLLWLASIFLENYTITWNARYRQLVNAIMLMNTLAILRGTFGNFRPLSLTTSTCVNLPRELYHYLERALSPTCERYNVNEHRRYPSGYFGNFRPLSLTTSTCVNLHKNLYHYLKRAVSPTCEHYNVKEHPGNPSGYFR